MIDESLEREVSSLATNLAPIVILASFVTLFVVTSYWQWNFVYFALSLFFDLFPLTVLAIVTYLLYQRLVLWAEPGESPK